MSLLRDDDVERLELADENDVWWRLESEHKGYGKAIGAGMVRWEGIESGRSLRLRHAFKRMCN